MTPKPLSIQLYTLRDEVKQDFVAVLRRVAAIGYKGVEPAGFHGLAPVEFRRIVEDLGMVISSTHSPWANKGNVNEVIDTCGVLGIDLVAAGYGPDSFKDDKAIAATAEELNTIDGALRAAGITLTLHNHWWEFDTWAGQLKIDLLLARAPGIRLELDTYWAANFGMHDAAAQVRRLAARAPLLHIKDGPFVASEKLLPVGAGRMDIPAVVAAIDPAVTRWLVVEQDNSATDMFTCVEQSYRYLTQRKLGLGNR